MRIKRAKEKKKSEREKEREREGVIERERERTYLSHHYKKDVLRSLYCGV